MLWSEREDPSIQYRHAETTGVRQSYDDSWPGSLRLMCVSDLSICEDLSGKIQYARDMLRERLRLQFLLEVYTEVRILIRQSFFCYEDNAK